MRWNANLDKLKRKFHIFGTFYKIYQEQHVSCTVNLFTNLLMANRCTRDFKTNSKNIMTPCSVLITSVIQYRVPSGLVKNETASMIHDKPITIKRRMYSTKLMGTKKYRDNEKYE